MRRNASGFTLIEIMVALAILAISMVTVYKSVAGYVSNAEHLEKRTLAQWVAVNIAEQIRLENPWPAPGKKELTLEEFAGHDWHIRYQVKKEGDAEWMRAVRIQVFLNEEETEPLSRLVFYLAMP